MNDQDKRTIKFCIGIALLLFIIYCFFRGTAFAFLPTDFFGIVLVVIGIFLALKLIQ